MEYQAQLKLERLIVAVIAIASVVGGLVAAYEEIYGIWPVLTACGIGITLIGFALLIRSVMTENQELAEAERRDKGMLLQDEMQAEALMRKYNECRERMGKDCCLHPEYQFNEKHRQVVGRE